MRLLTIFSDTNSVVAEITQDSDGQEICNVLRFLELVPKQYSSNAAGILDLMQRYAESGRAKLTTQQFHEATNDGIWEFKKGKLRVYCFMDGGSLLICSHAIVKGSQKTKNRDDRKANEFRRNYQEKVRTNEVVQVPREEFNHDLD